MMLNYGLFCACILELPIIPWASSSCASACHIDQTGALKINSSQELGYHARSSVQRLEFGLYQGTEYLIGKLQYNP